MFTHKRDTIVNIQSRNVLNFKNESRLTDITMDHYKRLISCINSYINQYADKEIDGWFLDFDDLTESDQNHLIALQLEEDGRDISYICESEEISTALMNLLNNNSYDKENFAELVRMKSINRYKKTLQYLIDDRCGWEEKEWLAMKGYDE